MKRRGSAIWKGDLKSGSGTVSSASGVLDATPYNFRNRFEDEPGTNPEELIGAAHAGCFSMALSLILSDYGLTADEIRTTADVTLSEVEGGFAITKVHLTLNARIPGADDETFRKAADAAKAGCPVSKVLNAEITLDASLEG